MVAKQKDFFMRQRPVKTAVEQLQEGLRSRDRLTSKDFSFYDTMVIDPVTPEVYMFTVPVSQAGKTFADTNMLASGAIPQGKKHRVHALKFFYRAPKILVAGETPSYRAKNVEEMMEWFEYLEKTVVSFELDGLDTYGQYTLQECFGMSTLVALTPAATFNTPQPEPFYKGIIPVNVPIELPSNQIFKMVVRTYGTIPESVKNDRLKISLQGFLLSAN